MSTLWNIVLLRVYSLGFFKYEEFMPANAFFPCYFIFYLLAFIVFCLHVHERGCGGGGIVGNVVLPFDLISSAVGSQPPNSGCHYQLCSFFGAFFFFHFTVNGILKI